MEDYPMAAMNQYRDGYGQDWPGDICVTLMKQHECSCGTEYVGSDQQPCPACGKPPRTCLTCGS